MKIELLITNKHKTKMIDSYNRYRGWQIKPLAVYEIINEEKWIESKKKCKVNKI